MPGKETYYNRNTNRYESRETRTSEDVAGAEDVDRLQNFRAPDTGNTPRFTPPKQQPGESLGAYAARVKKAKADWDESGTVEAQKQALKGMP